MRTTFRYFTSSPHRQAQCSVPIFENCENPCALGLLNPKLGLWLALSKDLALCLEMSSSLLDF